MDAIETEIINGYTVSLYPDLDPLNPRTEFDHQGTIYAYDRRNGSIGDETNSRWLEDCESWSEIKREIESDARKRIAVALPVYYHSHGTTAMYTGRADDLEWDGGPAGYIVAFREDILSEYNVQRISRRVREIVQTNLVAEVEEYSQYLTGDVYGYVVAGPDGEEIDSCWGLFGYDYAMKAARDEVPSEPPAEQVDDDAPYDDDDEERMGASYILVG